MGGISSAKPLAGAANFIRITTALATRIGQGIAAKGTAVSSSGAFELVIGTGGPNRLTVVYASQPNKEKQPKSDEEPWFVHF